MSGSDSLFELEPDFELVLEFDPALESESDVSPAYLFSYLYFLLYSFI